MADVFKINTNNTISYSQISVKTSGTGNAIYSPVGFINIEDIDDKYENRFQNQPGGSGS